MAGLVPAIHAFLVLDADASSWPCAIPEFVLAITFLPSQALAGTSYEAQIGGFIHSTLQTFITGEFAGRRPSQSDIAGLNRPVCKPADYDDLRAAANDQAAFDAFRRKCKFVDVKKDDTHVHGTAHLPRGYCETLKNAFETMLTEQVYSDTPDGKWEVVFEYKGSRYDSSKRALARGARLKTMCLDDGSLRVSAPRKRR
jgi:hypothetical protein